jgi:DNA-binding NarL/FixJ family response regulator
VCDLVLTRALAPSRTPAGLAAPETAVRYNTSMALGGPGAQIRVFILDDHEVVRRGLRDLFGQELDIEVIGDSASAAEAARRLPALRPDVAVLDARLPDGSGIEVCRQVRSQDPSIRALILTSYDDDEALFAAILAGADGYVLKQIAGSDLVGAVRQVASGRSMLDPAVTGRVLERLRAGPAEPEELRGLSDQERHILGYVAEGLTNRQISQRMFLSEKTVKNYVSHVLAKLGVERRTQAAVLAAKLLRE